MIQPQITLTDIGGIPAYTAESGGAFVGSLTFGVGRRDETAPTAGTAHLLEHLIMLRVGKVSIPHNASTGDETISFYAKGAPAHVADYLNRVARAVSTLSEVSDADVEEQRRVIAAELGEDDERPGRGALLDRFGAQGLGLLDVGAPGHRSITREQVLAFAESWLHAGNAGLTFTGPPPEGLDISLPAARDVPVRDQGAVIRSGAWVVNGSIPVCVTLVIDGLGDEDAAPLAGAIIEDALYEELRTKQALVYSIEPFAPSLGRGRRLLALALDPRPEDALKAATAAVRFLRGLAEAGPTPAMMSEAVASWRQYLEDPDIAEHRVDQQVAAVLRGRQAPDDTEFPDLSTITAERVRAVIAASIDSVFITFGDDQLSVDADAVTQELGLPLVQEGSPVYAGLNRAALFKELMRDEVESFSPRMFRKMGGSTLIIDPERIAGLFSDGYVEMDYQDVALALYSEAHRFWALLQTGGDLLIVDRDVWRGDGKIHQLLEARVPKDRQIRVDAVVK